MEGPERDVFEDTYPGRGFGHEIEIETDGFSSLVRIAIYRGGLGTLIGSQICLAGPLLGFKWTCSPRLEANARDTDHTHKPSDCRNHI